MYHYRSMRHSLLTAALLGCLAIAAPVFAHHSFAAEYDGNKPTTQTGVVTKIEWMNPHVYIYMDVKGRTARCITGVLKLSANTLRRVGLARDMLKVGDNVTVTGWLARELPGNSRGARSAGRTARSSSSDRHRTNGQKSKSRTNV